MLIKAKLKNFSIKALCVLVAVSLIALFSLFRNADVTIADENNDWRPSVELNKAIASTAQRYGELQSLIATNTAIVQDYELNSNPFTEPREQLEEKLSNLESYIIQQQSSIDEVTKNSYAAILAKSLLDEIVGNRFISSNLFHWNLVLMMATSGESEIYEILEDYVNTKYDYEEVLQNEQNIISIYQNAKNALPALQAELAQNQPAMDAYNNQLAKILPIEAERGAAGESRIVGNGPFANPCPEATVVATVGEQREGYTHKGVDLSANEGTPIYCAMDGKVVEATYNDDYNGGMGMCIRILTNDGFLTTYMHCSHVFVPVGMTVHKGDNIALVGNTGDSSGPHLHFQVEKDGQIINGLDLFNWN